LTGASREIICSPVNELVEQEAFIDVHYMLWFKFILGLMIFELVSILLPIVPDYNNG